MLPGEDISFLDTSFIKRYFEVDPIKTIIFKYKNEIVFYIL